MPLETPRAVTAAPKLPRAVLDEFNVTCPHTIYAFPPNRDTLGGTAYFILKKEGSILIDCPAWDQTNEAFLRQAGGVRWLCITHRGGIGKVCEIQRAFDCEVVIQEQEAYLLPELTVTPFQHEFSLSSTVRMFWTAGHSPGSSCVYDGACNVLFSGRHLVCDRAGNPAPLRTSKTFHWTRQIRHTQAILDRFTPQTLQLICPGASTGFLRGKGAIDHAYEKLAQLDLAACLKAEPML